MTVRVTQLCHPFPSPVSPLLSQMSPLPLVGEIGYPSHRWIDVGAVVFGVVSEFEGSEHFTPTLRVVVPHDAHDLDAHRGSPFSSWIASASNCPTRCRLMPPMAWPMAASVIPLLRKRRISCRRLRD